MLQASCNSRLMAEIRKPDRVEPIEMKKKKYEDQKIIVPKSRPASGCVQSFNRGRGVVQPGWGLPCGGSIFSNDTRGKRQPGHVCLLRSDRGFRYAMDIEPWR